MLIIKEVRGT